MSRTGAPEKADGSKPEEPYGTRKRRTAGAIRGRRPTGESQGQGKPKLGGRSTTGSTARQNEETVPHMTEKRAAHGPHLAGRTTKNSRSGRTRRQRKRGRPVRTRQDGETAGRRAPEQARILRDGAPRRTGLGKRGAAREPHRGGVTAGGREGRTRG